MKTFKTLNVKMVSGKRMGAGRVTSREYGSVKACEVDSDLEIGRGFLHIFHSGRMEDSRQIRTNTEQW